MLQMNVKVHLYVWRLSVVHSCMFLERAQLQILHPCIAEKTKGTRRNAELRLESLRWFVSCRFPMFAFKVKPVVGSIAFGEVHLSAVYSGSTQLFFHNHAYTLARLRVRLNPRRERVGGTCKPHSLLSVPH